MFVILAAHIDQHIVDLVHKCSKCTLVQKLPTKTELMSWSKPDRPWSRLHIDFAGPFLGKMFLLVIDALSKWPEICVMSSITSTATISKLNEMFARFGIPDTIISDNGTQFTSFFFKEFCEKNGIVHIRTAPFHPQSNGQAERFVDTLKRTILKLEGEEVLADALNIFLQYYRATPSAVLENKSPSELMFGRKIKTTLDLLRPTQEHIVQRNLKMENQFNLKNGAKQRSFELNELVYARDFRNRKPSWAHGKIKKNKVR